jgi:hypothetical protein
MSSASVASLIAHAAFWILLSYGWLRNEIGLKGIIAFLISWVVGLYGLPYALRFGATMFSPYVAVLDIVLALLILKRDVRLT